MITATERRRAQMMYARQFMRQKAGQPLPHGPWANPLIDANLRILWAAGLSISAIAAELGHGITRNSVVGRARRLGLPPRPSPIKRRVACGTYSTA